ncbi:alpha/beta hydrolase [Phyllobacterium sp. SB3]|uniref:alpha/beta fold hydrolase n=1 Tax=Phyllobacterium sp. SB3 TaxID=3156073 RepID=UPI0032AEA9D3
MATVKKLHFASRGEGPALVLLHPVGLDHSFWGGLVELCSRKYRVIAVDLRGHGRSPSAEGGENVADYVKDIEALFRDSQITSATVLGLSFGGMIAQELAIRRPDLVERLVAAACGARIPPEASQDVRARGDKADKFGMEAVVDETIERWFMPDFRSSKEVSRVRERLLTDSPAGWNAAWGAIAGHDTLARLPELTMPSLVVIGDHDAGTSMAAAEALADAIPISTLKVIQGAPHMLQIECPNRFAEAVFPFLGMSGA